MNEPFDPLLRSSKQEATMTSKNDNEPTLPAALIERLRERDRAVAILTPQLDRMLEQQARAQFAARPQAPARRRAPLWGLSAAAAAALVFVVIAVREPMIADQAPLSLPRQTAFEQMSLPGDYDGSGTVDVLDAWQLSRALAQNPRLAANDTPDTLMQRIVALDRGVQ